MNDLIGQKFWNLTIIERVGTYKNRKIKYKCQCDCGNITYSDITSLKTGNTKSCGCIKSKFIENLNKTHNESKTRLYKIWIGIKKRCYNPNCHSYHYYGKKGITMDNNWKKNFNSFKEWAINNGYDETLSIDRIDFNGNYEPNNCRWTNSKIQNNNSSHNNNLTINGITKSITTWAEENNINVETIRRRIKKGLKNTELIAPSYTYSNGRKRITREQIINIPVKIIGIAREKRTRL